MSVWSWKKSGWLSLVFCVVFLSAVILSWISSGLRTSSSGYPDDIHFDGGYFPELGVFNVLLYISALLGMQCVILRYVYVADKNAMQSIATVVLNKISILPGMSSFASMIFLASFSANSKQKSGTIQTVGAYVFFSMSLMYSFLQTILTYLYCKCTKEFLVRLLLFIFLTGSFISSIVLIEMNKSGKGILEIEENISVSNKTEKDMKKQVVNMRLLAFGMEKGFAIVYVSYFLSFFLEFQKISTYVILRPLILSTPSDYSSSWTVNERV